MSSDQRPPTTGAQRLLSLDVFRGLTILAMILVNNPGKWGDQYWPLGARRVARLDADRSHLSVLPVHRRHVAGLLAAQVSRRRADRAGRLLADRAAHRAADLPGLVARPAVARRSATSTAMPARSTSDTLRLPGVLVRIALVYFCASLIVLHVPLSRPGRARRSSLLLGYWAPAGVAAEPARLRGESLARWKRRRPRRSRGRRPRAHVYAAERKDRSRRPAQHAAGDRHGAAWAIGPACSSSAAASTIEPSILLLACGVDVRRHRPGLGTLLFRSTRRFGPAASCC